MVLYSGRLLGHLYAAEALVLLDKISEAVEHLNPEHVKELSLIFPSFEKDIDRDKMDIGTEQQKPLRGEAEITVIDNEVGTVCVVTYRKAVVYLVP
jgi:adenosyl cobinamide kinase/adenosyl cobinamide phosphate guanylyltransferase